MIDREYFAVVMQEHYIVSSFCRCGFKITATEEGDRDHQRGWSTNSDHMRRMFGRHLADVYNRLLA